MMQVLLQQQPCMELLQEIVAADRGGQKPVLQVLLDHSSDKGWLMARAASYGWANTVEHLLARGVHLPQRPARDMLERAVLAGQVRMVQVLLPQVTRTSSNLQGLLRLASTCMNTDIVQSLLTTVDTDAQLQELLVTAVEVKSVPIAQLILSHGADVNAGHLLAKAVQRYSLGMVQLLLSHGADVNAGQPLAIACSAWRAAFVEELLAHGADVNLGKPLAKAAAAGQANIVQMLLSHGADTSLGKPLVRAAEKLRLQSTHPVSGMDLSEEH
jgi:hypothetical protein